VRRVLTHCLGRPIYSYPVTLYLGIVLGLYAELSAARAQGVDTAPLLAATLILAAIALLGARLLFVALNWPRFRREPRRILRFAEGGASLFGGILLAVPCSLLLLPAFDIGFGAFWDLASFTMLVGMAVGRIGCFLNGCCAGRPYDGRLSMYLPDEQGRWRRRIPSQLLESAWSATVLAGLVVLWRRVPFDGALMIYTVIAYSAGRFALEALRERPDAFRGLWVQRAIALSLIAASLVAFAMTMRAT
jgi:phosphatidylglycerol---prolipoprotein diacylglyceryl transferase